MSVHGLLRHLSLSTGAERAGMWAWVWFGPAVATMFSSLGLLAGDVPELDDAGQDTSRWPDLAAAVHWLVDDTAWDVHDPVKSIGTILRDAAEAAAVHAVVAAVCAVSDRQGATAPDAY